MKSKMSFFDPTLLKKNLGRFAPAWAILTLALFLSLPLPLMRRLDRSSDSAEWLRSNIVRLLGEEVFPIGVVFAFCAALLFAALVFKYLHRTRDAYMMHAFPMTRRCQFITNAVSGLLFWIVPTLFNGLCVLGILAAYGVTDCGGLVWSTLGYWLLAYLCFYGIAVFAMHLSGRTVIAVLSYGALNFMFLVLPLMLLLLTGVYFKGFDYVITENILRLSPIVDLLSGEEPAETLMLWVYGGVGLALLVLSWILYRLRHVERAGDAMVYGWARVAFRLLFTLCVTLGFGWVLASIFGLIGNGGRGDGFLPYALIGCVLGWFGSSMMVERTVKVFKNKKVWLGFAAFAGVLVLTVLCLKYDVLGFQRRVPETAQVESVEIWTKGSYGDREADCIELTAPEDIDLVRAFHSRAVRSDSLEHSSRDPFGYDSYDDIHVLYHLKGGGTLRRVYAVQVQSMNEDFSDLSGLYCRPDIVAAWYEKTLPQQPERYAHVTLYGVTEHEYGLGRQESMSGEELECKDRSALRAAVLADAAAGRLPIMNFLTQGSYFDDGRIVERGYTELYLCFEGRERDDQPRHYLQIPIASSAEETLKLFLR
ncbi:MAG: hypothetical protein IKH07_07470 [Oscillospiraceae bacterium]|nr:hypothetical protein [Oscillospiraceae bacterium]